MTDRTALLRDIARIGEPPQFGGFQLGDEDSPDLAEPEYVLSQIALGQKDERSLVIALTIGPPNADELSPIGTDPETFVWDFTWYLGGYLALDSTLKDEILEQGGENAAVRQFVEEAEELVPSFEKELARRSKSNAKQPSVTKERMLE